MKRLFAVTTAVLLASALPLRAGEIPDRAFSSEVDTGSHQENASSKSLERRSGATFMTPDTKAIQDDDTANPSMLWALEGEELWTKKDGTNEKACADCHDDARSSMKGVAARYPAFDRELGRPVDLEQRVNLCRARHQQAQPFAYESRELLALTAFVAQQSRGMPITAGSDEELAPFVAKGHDLFRERQGQLNLSCANCHDDNWDKHLAGSAITQGHPTGYPLYRLEWQSLGSLQRRLRGCIFGVRAQPYAFGAPELVDLELYLMKRAAGMPMEAPAVRP
jgi:L-cysteine S-thiosulfotransferase